METNRIGYSAHIQDGTHAYATIGKTLVLRVFWVSSVSGERPQLRFVFENVSKQT